LDTVRLGQDEHGYGPPRDAVIRMFYVGMTRAREALFLADRASSMAAHLIA
jgi:superfamily I DNA/RNA helicase